MRFRSLESRIVVLFLILILAVQLAGFLAIRIGIENNSRAAIVTELGLGERVFQRLLDQNAQKLTQGAKVLATDYGFRQAIGSDDVETITSALTNNEMRIGASLSVLVGLDRTIKASTITNPSATIVQSIIQLVGKAEQTGGASQIGIVEGKPFQLVIAPVKAPVTIGWIAMAFPIDIRLANDMRALTSLQVSILTGTDGGNWTSDISTLPKPEQAALVEFVKGFNSTGPRLPEMRLGDTDFSTRVVPLARDSGQISLVFLQRSINEAVAPYRQLQLTLLLLSAFGIAIAVLGSIYTAKRITEPLRELGNVAKRLGAGEYDTPITMKRRDEIGQLADAFGSMREGIANRELEIRRLAYWDTLTDLPNRAQFALQLSEAITRAAERKESCFILMMDLDRFKNVNDVLGHSFGDALLRQVAVRLKLQVGGDLDQVARFGGDEFAILLPNTDANGAVAVATRILKSLEVPISLDDQTVDLGAGIGITGFPEHGDDAEALLSYAEIAMYAAKRSAIGAIIYNPKLDKGSQQNLSLLSELRHAAEHGEFRLFVQPKIMFETGTLVGVEALVRWVHPDKGMIYPDQFIPFAEQSGFIRVLTRWVLEQSAALCTELAAQGLHPKISINLSARDLLDQNLAQKFSEILARNGVVASSFCLEITESSIMDDPVRALQTLDSLHDLGVDLSIDDFGTGYSSLAYLKRLPVDELKIDKSFVMNMEKDADDSSIVLSTIDLGHNMGLRVVAEGIESRAVWDLLAKMGCDQGQGYFMSRPMPAEDIGAWAKGWQPLTPPIESTSGTA